MSSFSQSHNIRRLLLAALLLGGVLSFVSALSTLASSGSPARSVAALTSTRPARLPASTIYPDYLPLILKAPPTATGSPGGATITPGPSPTSTPIGWTYDPRCSGIAQLQTFILTSTVDFNTHMYYDPGTPGSSPDDLTVSEHAKTTVHLDKAFVSSDLDTIEWRDNGWVEGQASIDDAYTSPYGSSRVGSGPVKGDWHEILFAVNLPTCRYYFHGVGNATIDTVWTEPPYSSLHEDGRTGFFSTDWRSLPPDPHRIAGSGSFQAHTSDWVDGTVPVDAYAPDEQSEANQIFAIYFNCSDDACPALASVSWDMTAAH